MSQKTFCDVCDRLMDDLPQRPFATMEMHENALAIFVYPEIRLPAGHESADICTACLINAMHQAKVPPQRKED